MCFKVAGKNDANSKYIDEYTCKIDCYYQTAHIAIVYE